MQVGEATVPFRSEYERHRLTPRHTAYLRVAEGCNHACTFCAIPSFRSALMLNLHQIGTTAFKQNSQVQLKELATTLTDDLQQQLNQQLSHLHLPESRLGAW